MIPRDRRWTTTALAVVAALLLPAGLSARELSWRALEVTAKLESDGTLAVSEMHAMVFTGDWNGGERTFRLEPGQRLEIVGLFRLDAESGAWRPMERGSLDSVDRWDWHDTRTIRWRSRRPTDPLFDATEIGYRIDYRLAGILSGEGTHWRLDHDFAFPDRYGAIEQFALELELAPEWSATDPIPRRIEVGPLQPGAGWVFTRALDYHGAAPPERAGVKRLSSALRLGALGAAVLGVVALFGWALGRERAVGRLRPLLPVDGVDRGWIEEHVLTLAPEEVGAAWDDEIGAAEVAAVLARLQLEGKISSRVEHKRFLWFSRDVLHLRLEVPRARFTQNEKKLISGLFPSGDSTDTDSLRKHYRTSGFDPAGKIKEGLLRDVRRHPEFADARPHPPRLPSVLGVLFGATAMVVAIVAAPADGAPILLLGAGLCAGWLFGFVGAYRLRDRVFGFAGPAAGMAIGQLVALAALTSLSLHPSMSAIGLFAGVLFHLGLTRTVATSLQTREGPQRIAARRELARARAWIARELESKAPRLDDSWLPYLVAFGLSPQMDRWFSLFGGTSEPTAASTWSTGSGWSGASGGSGWSGGGGAFGGAGATASWAAAATAMSAGVSAASSSSGGGGGGGGGGSSGGGGGGGW